MVQTLLSSSSFIFSLYTLWLPNIGLVYLMLALIYYKSLLALINGVLRILDALLGFGYTLQFVHWLLYFVTVIFSVSVEVHIS